MWTADVLTDDGVPLSVMLGAGAASDAAGWPNVASEPLERKIDLTRPAVSLTTTLVSPTMTVTIPVTADFTEDVAPVTTSTFHATTMPIWVEGKPMAELSKPLSITDLKPSSTTMWKMLLDANEIQQALRNTANFTMHNSATNHTVSSTAGIEVSVELQYAEVFDKQGNPNDPSAPLLLRVDQLPPLLSIQAPRCCCCRWW